MEPVASCLVCGQEKELAVWVDPAITGGSFHGVCFQCRQAAQQSVQLDGAEALQFCEICQSWHGKQHITTRDVSPRR